MKKFLFLLFVFLSFNFFAQADMVYYKSGVTKLRAQNYKAAEEDFTKAIELNPKNARAYSNRAFCENRLYNYKAAIDDYDKVAELEPKNYRALRNGNLSRWYLARSGGTPLDFNSHPNDAKAYGKTALAKEEKGDYEGAIKDYTAAIEANPSAGLYFARGEVKYKTKDFSGAIKDFTQAIERDAAKYAKAYLNRGSAQYSLGNKTDACADWRQASLLGISQANDALNKFCK